MCSDKKCILSFILILLVSGLVYYIYQQRKIIDEFKANEEYIRQTNEKDNLEEAIYIQKNLEGGETNLLPKEVVMKYDRIIQTYDNEYNNLSSEIKKETIRETQLIEKLNNSLNDDSLELSKDERYEIKYILDNPDEIKEINKPEKTKKKEKPNKSTEVTENKKILKEKEGLSIDNTNVVLCMDSLLLDGKLTIASCSKNSIKLWDYESGVFVNSLDILSSKAISILTLSVDNTDYLLIGEYSGDIVIWSSKENSTRKLSQNGGSVISLSSIIDSKKQQLILAGYSDGTIKVWEFYTGKLLKTLYGSETKVTGMLNSSDNKTMISFNYEGQIISWDVSKDFSLLKKEKAHIGKISAFTFSENGDYLITGSLDRTIKIFKNSSLEKEEYFNKNQEGIHSLNSININGQELIASISSKNLSLFKLNGDLFDEIAHSKERFLIAKKVISDGKSSLLVSDGNFIRIFN